MKKIIVLAVAVLMGASLTPASAAKKKQNAGQRTPAQLVTHNDSLSFAAGQTLTTGLMNFLKQQYDIDESNLAQFIKGIEEALDKGDKAEERAYAAGVTIAHTIKDKMYPGISKDLGNNVDEKLFVKGFISALLGDSVPMKHADAEKYYREQVEAAKKAKLDETIKAGEAFLRENAKKEGVKTTESGLQYKILKAGNGEIPAPIDEVEVIYEGRLIDGTVFDATSKHNGQKTDKFRADRVIKGWTEALTMMPVGSKWQIYIPQNLAYGDRAAGDIIKPGSTLVFDIELVGVKKNAPKKK
jgi:FKBP-type peptidyl-prolyl cis-trans isomerase FklB